MADNLKAAAFAAGLTPQEQKKVEEQLKAQLDPSDTEKRAQVRINEYIYVYWLI